MKFPTCYTFYASLLPYWYGTPIFLRFVCIDPKCPQIFWFLSGFTLTNVLLFNLQLYFSILSACFSLLLSLLTWAWQKKLLGEEDTLFQKYIKLGESHNFTLNWKKNFSKFNGSSFLIFLRGVCLVCECFSLVNTKVNTTVCFLATA